MQWESMGDCGPVGYRVVLTKFIQSGDDLTLALDLDGNHAFDDGALVAAVVGSGGDHILVSGTFDWLGATHQLNGRLDSINYGLLAGSLTETVGGCQEQLSCVGLWTANPPSFDIAGVWDATSDITWVNGNTTLSVGAGPAEEWTIETLDSVGAAPGIFKVTLADGAQFIGVLNSSQVTMGRRWTDGPETFTWQYCTLNRTPFGGSHGDDLLSGQVAGLFEGLDQGSFGLNLFLHKRP